MIIDTNKLLKKMGLIYPIEIPNYWRCCMAARVRAEHRLHLYDRARELHPCDCGCH